MAPDGLDAAEVRLNRLLNLILETAVEALGFSAATVSVRRGDGLSTVGATDQRLVGLDDAQYEGGGPCVAVLDDSQPRFLRDAAETADTWQHFADKAAELGVCSTLSMHVPTDSPEVAASLNLYALEMLEMNERQVRLAAGYAEQLAAILQSVDAYRSTADLARNMAEAMRTRAVIEQAKGMLMVDEQIGDQEAFQRLVSRSQHSNIKVHEVARRLVDQRGRPPSAP
jgi:ANTAR domain/GAF domain